MRKCLVGWLANQVALTLREISDPVCLFHVCFYVQIAKDCQGLKVLTNTQIRMQGALAPMLLAFGFESWRVVVGQVVSCDHLALVSAAQRNQPHTRRRTQTSPTLLQSPTVDLFWKYFFGNFWVGAKIDV